MWGFRRILTPIHFSPLEEEIWSNVSISKRWSVAPDLRGALISGILLACPVALAARLETGYPPGITPPPFARLLDQPAPPFSLDGLHGAPVSSGDAPAGRSWLLFFSEASCQACDATYPALARDAAQFPVIVVAAGERAVLQGKLAPHGLVSVAGHDSLREVNEAYGVQAYP